MAETVQLSRNVRAGIDAHPLRAGRMNILTTGTDVGANNFLTSQLAANWAERNPGRVTIFEFPQAEGVPHDMIDPNQPDAKIQASYPKILELLGVPTPVSHGKPEPL
jgi:carboxylesterase